MAVITHWVASAIFADMHTGANRQLLHIHMMRSADWAPPATVGLTKGLVALTRHMAGAACCLPCLAGALPTVQELSPDYEYLLLGVLPQHAYPAHASCTVALCLVVTLPGRCCGTAAVRSTRIWEMKLTEHDNDGSGSDKLQTLAVQQQSATDLRGVLKGTSHCRVQVHQDLAAH